MDLYWNMTDHDYHILFHIQFFTYHFTYKFTTWASCGPSLVRSQRVTTGAFSLYTPEISAQNRYPQGLATPATFSWEFVVVCVGVIDHVFVFIVPSVWPNVLGSH